MLKDRDARTNVREGTFVGTPLYVAPEMIEMNYSGKFTDLWALGCIIYQMICGTTPFQGKNSNEVYSNILERKLLFNSTFDTDAKDLIDRLLNVIPEKRLGMKSYDELKQHPYFADIDFLALESRLAPVPGMSIFRRDSSITEESSEDSSQRR